MRGVGGQWAVLRRSAAVSLLPSSLVLVGLHLTLRPRPWIHEWYWSFDSYWFVTVLLGPVVAGTGCWEATRWQGAREYLVSSGRLTRAVVQVLAGATVWAVAAFAAGLAAVVVMVKAGGAPGWPTARVVVSAAPAIGLLVLCAAVGTAAGWMCGRALAAPLAAAAVFLALLGGYTVLPGQWLAIGGATATLLSLSPRTGLHLAQTGLYLVLSALVVRLATGRLDRLATRPRFGTIGLAICGVGLLAGLAFQGGMRFIETPAEVSCSGARPTICVAPSYSHLEPAVRDAVVGPFVAFEEAGFRPPSRLSQDLVTVGGGTAMALGVEVPTTPDVVSMLVFSVIPPTCDTFRDRETFQNYLDVVYWVESLLGVAAADDPTISAEVAGGDSGQARRHVQRIAERLAQCGS